jgi:hypothetical protein
LTTNQFMCKIWLVFKNIEVVPSVYCCPGSSVKVKATSFNFGVVTGVLGAAAVVLPAGVEVLTVEAAFLVAVEVALGGGVVVALLLPPQADRAASINNTAGAMINAAFTLLKFALNLRKPHHLEYM